MYERPDGSWDMEREQADFDQADLERAGREAARSYRRSLALILSGDLEGAATTCRHGAGIRTRCLYCGSDANDKPRVALSAGPAGCPKCLEPLAISCRGAICKNEHSWELKMDSWSTYRRSAS